MKGWLGLVLDFSWLAWWFDLKPWLNPLFPTKDETRVSKSKSWPWIYLEKDGTDQATEGDNHGMNWIGYYYYNSRCWQLAVGIYSVSTEWHTERHGIWWNAERSLWTWGTDNQAEKDVAAVVAVNTERRVNQPGHNQHQPENEPCKPTTRGESKILGRKSWDFHLRKSQLILPFPFTHHQKQNKARRERKAEFSVPL